MTKSTTNKPTQVVTTAEVADRPKPLLQVVVSPQVQPARAIIAPKMTALRMTASRSTGSNKPCTESKKNTALHIVENMGGKQAPADAEHQPHQGQHRQHHAAGHDARHYQIFNRVRAEHLERINLLRDFHAANFSGKSRPHLPSKDGRCQNGG